MVSLNAPPVGIQEYAAVSDNSMLIKWSPGDGAVYTMVASEIAWAICEGLGCDECALMVSLGFPGQRFRSYPLIPGQVESSSYIAEKFGFRGGDLAAFTALVNFALCPEGGPEWDLAMESFKAIPRD